MAEIRKSLLVELIICMALLVSNTAAQNDDDGSSESCQDDAWFSVQPPTNLNCTLMEGEFIFLRCHSYSTERLGNVTWYWTRCAGGKGTAIGLEDISDKYGVSHQIFNRFNAHSTLFFQITDATLGYYWCKISNNETTVFRSSTITPVLLNTDTSLPSCTFNSIESVHNYRMGRECAVEGSPTIYPRVPLPSFCPSDTSTVNLSDTIFGIALSRNITIAVLSVCGALFIILVLVIVILCACLCCKSKQLPKAKQETLAVSNPCTDQVEMVSNNAYGASNVGKNNIKKKEVVNIAYETVDLHPR